MSADRKIRMVCVDDSEETRTLFALILDGQHGFETVARLSDVRALEQCIATTQPELVVLDLWMPGQDPLAAMASALRRFPGQRFLVLSSDDDPEQIERALESGATGYAVKDGDFEKLADAVRRVAAGETVRPRGWSRGGLAG